MKSLKFLLTVVFYMYIRISILIHVTVLIVKIQSIYLRCRNLFFSFTKWEMTCRDYEESQTVRQPPSPAPETLYFETGNGNVDHVTVLSEMKKLLNIYKGTSVQSVQYIPNNKWKVVMDSLESRNRLAGSSIVLNGSSVCLRRYDDVANLEYRKYLRTLGYISMVNNTN